MMKNEPINVQKLLEKAKASEHKEAYRQIERNKTYRIGIGARVETTTPSFFVEIIINLTLESNEVNIHHLEKTINCLKHLREKNYTLTYQDFNCISCEANIEPQNLTKEYTTALKLLKTFKLS
jgi:hypothetical protein